MKAPMCGHLACWDSAISKGDGRQVVCDQIEDDALADDRCEHRAEADSHHPCMECAWERSGAKRDMEREAS